MTASERACTSCGARARVTSSGRVLTTDPTRLGIFDPSTGEVLTARQITERIRLTSLAGHSEHRCLAPTQPSLFEETS